MKLTHFLLILMCVFCLVACSSGEQNRESQQESKEDTAETEGKNEGIANEDEEVSELKIESDLEEVSIEPEIEIEEEVTDDSGQETDEEIGIVEFEDITFYLPKNAKELVIDNFPFPIAAYYLDENQITNFNVLAEPLPQALTLEEYITIATSMTGYNYVSNEYFSVGEIDWNETISVNNQSGPPIQLIQRTFILNDHAYVFSFASPPDYQGLSLEIFNALTESVEIIQ
nr:hypothetical protein [Lysinibacillus timonensis]